MEHIERKEMKTARDGNCWPCTNCNFTDGYSITVRGSWIDGEWSAGSIHAFDSRTKPACQFITANCKHCGEYARLTMRFAEELLNKANSKEGK